MGGAIAFEMVKQLEEAGEKVAFLGLFDSPCLRRPGESFTNTLKKHAKKTSFGEKGTNTAGSQGRAMGWGRRPPFEKPPPGTVKHPQNFLLEFTLPGELEYIREYVSDQEMIRNLEKVTGIDDLWPAMVDYLEEHDTAAESIKKVITENGIPYYDYNRASTAELIHSLNMTRTLLKARDKYIPSGKVKARTHYFEALESKEIIKRHWDKYCEADVKYYTIPGDHFSIFKKPQVEKFAQIFLESLKDTVFQQ